LLLLLPAMAGVMASCASYPENTVRTAPEGRAYVGQTPKAKGTEILDSQGKPIMLKGTNLGNWLVPEGYMFKMGKVSSPRKIDELLHEIIGPDNLDAFWHSYLENYITLEDIKYLKRTGSN